MEQSSSQAQGNFWDRWTVVWSIVFYLSVLIPAAIALTGGTLEDDRRGWLIGLSVLACGWHWLWTAGVPRWRPDPARPALRDRPGQAGLYLLGAALIWTGLASLSGFFFIHLAGLYSQIYLYLPIRLAIPATVALTAISILLSGAIQGQSLSIQDGQVWGPLLGVAAASILGIFISGISGESARRQALLEELRQTQAELAESERAAGVLAERQRLAHEIHDTLAQGFVGIIICLETAAQELDPTTVAGQHVKEATLLARENLQQTRYLVEDLRPQPLQEATLPEAVAKVVTRWREWSGAAAHLTITGDERPLDDKIEHALLRAVQETLANVAKHAGAQEVTVTLSYMDDRVMLDVQDDGIGLTGAPSEWAGGFGLTAMRERAEELGGSLLVESEAGDGVTVVVSIPTGDKDNG